MSCDASSRLHAQSLDPFATESHQWKSFDRYQEEEKDRLFSTMTGDIEADSRAALKAEAEDIHSDPEPIAKTATDAEKETKTPPALDSSVVAAPDRPLDPPIMPGMNGGFDVRTSSTEDDTKPVARIVNVESDPTVQLPKQNWLDAARAAMGNGEEDHTPLHIRMSFLPGFEAPQKTSASKTAVLAPPVREVAPKTAADAAACAAIDAYKKKQLEAIQSDRATLAALQGAIRQLGLEKKLDFMPGSGSKLNATADKSALMDMPVAAPPALPPVGKP